MTRARSLVWLIALVAFVVPSFGTATASHATPPVEQAASVACPDHAPPPEECPEHGTANHAAGQCCPLMSCTFAVMPPTVVAGALLLLPLPVAAAVRHLVGLTFTQDPPPPRV